jgi:hypothetical protein
MKLTPVVNCINILRTHFYMKVLCAAVLYQRFGFEFFWHKNIVKKGESKMLMKLSPGILRQRSRSVKEQEKVS